MRKAGVFSRRFIKRRRVMKTIEKEGKIFYQCDVCGSEYESEDEAQDCEARCYEQLASAGRGKTAEESSQIDLDGNGIIS